MIVDEAAQCTEPQCIIPLGVKPSLFVLVGDSHQLAATIQNITIDRMGFGRSLFERWETLGFPKLSLRVQYRMAPEICLWPNSYVYKGELIDSKRVQYHSFRFLFDQTKVPAYAFIDIASVGKVLRHDLGGLREGSKQLLQCRGGRRNHKHHSLASPSLTAIES